ncbi:hypothetical protein NQ318_022722 [Aromia moschata]|uniref:Uncharacterized protein n=1 Tax=Aromia moschata TaxID=1265417 RepID=A0AAV8YAN8_9CUCU|nr:hypothetical protein NQ318_022722 [Aromia moschata]
MRPIGNNAVILSLLLVAVSGEVLLKKGWYRTHRKGPKIVLANVTFNRRQNLSFCGISDVDPGAFVNLPNLVVLGLLDNEIKSIKAGVFNGLKVSTLFLQRNQIKLIDSQAFDDMPNLFKIHLNSNKISTWDNAWFKNTPRLTEILFRRNEIQRIPSDAFRNIKGKHVKDGEYVVDTKIYLSKNNISFVDPDALNNLEELSQLWLDRNRISQLDEKVFSRVTQIGGLFLSKNKLRSMPDDMFPRLNDDIVLLDLTGNHNLTCLSYKIVSKTKLTVVDHIKSWTATASEN